MTRSTFEDDYKIGQRIRAARIGAGMSQEKLGEALGLTFQQVQKYEKGTNRVSGGRLLRVAAILDTSVAALVGETGDITDDTLAALATHDGHALVRAFNAIKNAESRALVLALAEKFAKIP